MNRSKKRVAIIGAITMLLAGLAAASGGSTASGQESATIEMGTVAAHPTPIAGRSGSAPTVSASEAGISPSVAVPSGGAPSESGAAPESVIGADGRVRVTNTTTYPRSAIGQIEFFQSGNFICTGWLIDRNTILAAGHCAYDPFGGGPTTSATFFPGRNAASNPFGSCAVTSYWVPPTEWQINGQPYYDFSVMNFANPGPCQAIGDTTGWFGLYANANVDALNNALVTVQGYPGDKPFGTHWRMAGHIAKGNKRFVFYPMDTFGGQSGSPVWANRASGPCIGACGYAIHAYGVGLPGPFGANNNGGPRLTAFRLGQIYDFADNNGT